MLWVITSYFNPCGYQSRRRNYGVFRRRLQAPLVTVELSFDGEFQLQPDEADIMVRVRGGDVIWQKERMLNVALAHLPGECEMVAWIDCDVFFADDRWPAKAREALGRHSAIQLYSTLLDVTDEAGASSPSASWRSVMNTLSDGGIGFDSLVSMKPRSGGSRFGMAWVARRDWLDRHGFYDACVIGGGDRAMAAALFGSIQELCDFQLMNKPRAEHYQDWATQLYQTVRGNVGFIEGTLYHLWHGEFGNRYYKERHLELSKFDFDPTTDLALDAGGAWRWNSRKPEMHRFVREYFFSRQEDGPPPG